MGTSVSDASPGSDQKQLFSPNNINSEIPGIRFVDYRDESQLDDVMSLVASDLSEPYSSTFSVLAAGCKN